MRPPPSDPGAGPRPDLTAPASPAAGPTVLVCLDVHYHDDGTATAALLTFPEWTSAAAARHVAHLSTVEP